MKVVLAAIILLFGGLLSVAAQTVCPTGLICLNQAQANIAAQNARELEATKAENVILKEQVEAEKGNVKAAQAVDKQNQLDAAKALNETSVKLGEALGENIELKADRVRWVAVVDVLVKNSRAKKIGILNL